MHGRSRGNTKALDKSLAPLGELVAPFALPPRRRPRLCAERAPHRPRGLRCRGGRVPVEGRALGGVQRLPAALRRRRREAAARLVPGHERTRGLLQRAPARRGGLRRSTHGCLRLGRLPVVFTRGDEETTKQPPTSGKHTFRATRAQPDARLSKLSEPWS